MKIERLILQGFKSFGERTSLEFGPGIWGIVGPNGSGKSNLVEALRWVVGARARELRGEEALSLLFHGSEGKAPLGFAEVSLELGGRGRRIQISRRLDRDGFSEVRLDGARSSLRQIEQALLGTGLSRSGYAIVGQGEVGQILQAGPEVLLAYLEEAAGLRAVAQASQVAHQRLEQATLELEQRTQELRERQSVAEEKAQQAELAQRATALAGRSLALRKSLLQARIREAAQEARAAQEKAQHLEQEQNQARMRLEALEKEKALAMEALEAAQNTYSEALRRAEELKGELRLTEQERGALEGLLRRLSTELAEVAERHARLKALPEPTPPGQPEPEAEALGRYEQRLHELQSTLQLKERQAQAQQQAYERYLQAQATYQAQKRAFEEAQAQKATLEAEASHLEQALSALEEKLAAARQRQRELRAALDALVREEGQRRSEAQAASAEARRLEAFLRAGSDLAEGPKKVRDSGIPGLIGVVADLIRVPSGLELALEVALGGRMQWVLTQDEPAAQAAVAYLKQHGGRATFLPRTLLRRAERSFSQSGQPGVVGLARHLVELPACPEALPTLLGETLVMESLEAALALWRTSKNPPRMVTLEGELLEHSGAITGGRIQRGGQMLALRRRYQEAQAEAERLEAEAQALQARTQALKTALAELGLAELERQQTQLSFELKALQGSLARFQALTQPEAPSPVAPPQPERLEALRQEREALREALARARELGASWQRYHENLERYQEAQAQAKALELRQQQLKREQSELEKRLVALQTRRAELEQARQALNLADLEGRLQTIRGRTRALAEEETRLLARTNAILADLEALHLTRARREAAIETLEQELASLPPGPPAREEGPSRSLARTLAEVEAALEALGPVNHLAEQEYALLAAEVRKLEQALKESEQVVRRLEAELQRVEAEYQERLQEVYGVFKERFAHYAHALLEAEAGLKRTPAGLELVLKPAGKRTIHLNLLSMGERTMGALAFLFALSGLGQSSSGLPIAVLDEVDAPLDEANIQRFCRFLQHFRGQTQFILVTHQKRTMEACDGLYGVTTERGLSRVYSIKQEKALT
ncbi:AAA family ATPase [Meiothermus rufus]|uniref:AAA family ATPase n=1 Tax=Meiothermus rufus TaxID=604332 RepID=UPI0004072A15|nr:chromosome segregation SMC family protein [Meiothermus rufus]